MRFGSGDGYSYLKRCLALISGVADFTITQQSSRDDIFYTSASCYLHSTSRSLRLRPTLYRTNSGYMAELIGIVSGIAGLVHLTLVVSQESHDYVQKVRNAPKMTSRYLQEVVALGVVLLRMEEVLSLPGVAGAVSADTDLLPKSLIEECQIELETIKGRLEKRITPGHGFASKLHALSWPFEEKEMKQLVEQLARWNSIFNSLATTCSLLVFLP